jgi:aspartyl/asparaginyl beta-hydroxylase (cupin superfamily)
VRADAAARRGDRVAARDHLHAAVAASPDRQDLWLKLGSMLRATGDPRSALEATRRALELDPLDFLALLFKAGLLEQLGDPGAGEAYGHAVAQAPADESNPAVRQALAGARAKHEAFTASRHALLATAMAHAEAEADQDGRRKLARFRDNVVRRTRVYHSEPVTYHFPGLVEREFHPRAGFPWLAEFESRSDVIRAEFGALLTAEHGELVPYVQYPADIPVRQWKTLNNNPAWTAIHLLRKGERIAANADHCPATMAAIGRLPQPDIAGRSPNAMFSLLAPGARIPPHTGIANTRLVCHLPLIVPPNCWFRVGAETREWVEGEAFVFDDTIEHEAANESGALRVVLIVDVWHPGLDAAERAGVTALMTAEDAGPGGDL